MKNIMDRNDLKFVNILYEMMISSKNIETCTVNSAR